MIFWVIFSCIIGVIIMIYGDDFGLMMLFCIVFIQVVVILVGCKDNFDQMVQEGEKLVVELCVQGLCVKVDGCDGVINGFKYNDWEFKGVLVCIEFGLCDLESGVLVVKNCYSEDKEILLCVEVVSGMSVCLDIIYDFLMKWVMDFLLVNIVEVDSYDVFQCEIEVGYWVCVYYCGELVCEKSIKEDIKVIVCNVFFDDVEFFVECGEGQCVKCGQLSVYGKWVLFGCQY